MAADGQVNINLKITAENGGVEKAEKGLDRVKNAAKRTSSESKGGFEQMREGIGKVTGAVGLLRNALSGFGIAGIVMSAINAYKSWQEEIKKTEEKAKELREELSLKSAANEIKEVADSYKALTDAINETASARSRENELFSEEVRIRREAQDAEMSAAESQAITEVDPNAEDADKQKQRIRERFAADRARLTADRKKEDVVFKRQNLQQQADDANKAAAEIEASLSGDDKTILRARTRASTLEALSKELNDKDGTWYNPRKRTEEGDTVREKQRKDAEAARQEVERLENEKRTKEKQAEELRAKATHAEKMKSALYSSIETADVERNTATVNQKSTDAANVAADKKQADKITDAEAAKRALTQQKADIQAKIAAEQAKKDTANYSVYQAQGTMDSARLGGNRRSQQSALENLQEAQNAAQNVNHAADTAINALTETLKNVEARLKAAQSFLENQAKQQRNAWSESPAGS